MGDAKLAFLVLLMIVLLIVSRVIRALTRGASMLAAAVSLLLVAYWGVHAANGAFTHGRRWTATYRVAERHRGTNGYLALEPLDARSEAPPLRVDPDLLPSTRVGDDVSVQLAEGRLGHTWVVSYQALP